MKRIQDTVLQAILTGLVVLAAAYAMSLSGMFITQNQALRSIATVSK